MAKAVKVSEAFDKRGKKIVKGDKVRNLDGKVCKVRALQRNAYGHLECLVILTGFLAVLPFWERAETLEKV